MTSKPEYPPLQTAYDDATRSVDEAISNMDKVLEQLKKWKQLRATTPEHEELARNNIDTILMCNGEELQKRLTQWRKAALAEFNYFNSHQGHGLAKPRCFLG